MFAVCGCWSWLHATFPNRRVGTDFTLVLKILILLRRERAADLQIGLKVLKACLA